jgi:hypothetical protein
MPAHVQGRILSLSKRICGRFAQGAGASGDSPSVVRVHVGHRYHDPTTGGIRGRTPFYHNDGARADMHLDAVVADAQSLPKTESVAQPTRSGGDIGVGEFWDHGTRRHRAIGGHKSSDLCGLTRIRRNNSV